LTLLADEIQEARLDWRLGLATLSIATSGISVTIESRT